MFEQITFPQPTPLKLFPLLKGPPLIDCSTSTFLYSTLLFFFFLVAVIDVKLIVQQKVCFSQDYLIKGRDGVFHRLIENVRHYYIISFSIMKTCLEAN